MHDILLFNYHKSMDNNDAFFGFSMTLYLESHGGRGVDSTRDELHLGVSDGEPGWARSVVQT